MLLAAFGALAALVMPAPGSGAAAVAPSQQPPAARSRSPLETRVRVEARSRVEHLADEAGRRSLFLRLELEDARAYASDAAPLNTTHVNPLEVLEARVGLVRSGVLADGDELSLAAGRLTMNVGGRRLVARNAFRNTINGFTGVDVSWTGRGAHELRAFSVLPVSRRPGTPDALADNRIELDREDADALLSGLFYGSAPLGARGLRVEGYAIYLHERDGDEGASADRRLLTPGLRVVRPSSGEGFDFQLELIEQVGTSRASSSASDVTNLDHRAFSGHATAAYALPAAWSPRLALVYDFATGDGDPTDGENGRFDPLYGARRFELGPTGFFGAFARSNVRSPGLRLQAAPASAFSAMVAYRLYWLASARDAWTTAGVRDPDGGSGTFLGHQVETWLRAQLVLSRLDVEVGGAWLARGAFAETAPGGRAGSPVYGYVQLTFSGGRS